MKIVSTYSWNDSDYEVESKESILGCCGLGPIMFSGEEDQSKINKMMKQLIRIGDAKVGQVFQCQICSDYWYMPENSHYINHVKRPHNKAFRKWCGSKLLVNEKICEVLTNIKPTIDKDFYSQKDKYCFPCCATTKRGKNINYALVVLVKVWPAGTYDHVNVTTIDNIKKIQPSKYALPKDVRDATTTAEEVSMGFYPTSVFTDKNKGYSLNGHIWFVNNKKEKVIGSKLRLWNKGDPLVEEDLEAGVKYSDITLIIADQKNLDEEA